MNLSVFVCSVIQWELLVQPHMWVSSSQASRQPGSLCLKHIMLPCTVGLYSVFIQLICHVMS